jgi:hypothetical protein
MSAESHPVGSVSDVMPYNKILRPRPLASLMYFLYMGAGAAVLFLTSTGIRTLLGEFGFIVWNSFLFGGAMISLFGTLVVKRYAIEIVGYPFLLSAMCVYAIYLFTRINESPQPGAVLFLSLVFAAATTGLFGRLIEAGRVVLIQRNFRRESKQRAADG